MTGVVHSLSASITSALAVKPSTVYVLRVENTATHDVWHLRRCFSEFCDLRERMLVLLDGGSVPTTTTSSSAQNSPTTATTPGPTISSLTARRLLALNPSLRSSPKPGSSTTSPRSVGSNGSGVWHERYPYVYAKFPRRQFFGSRTKKVIEQRTLALTQFLHEALWLLREVKTQPNIAMYFSLMTQLEVFLQCSNHRATVNPNATVTATTTPPASAAKAPPSGVCPPFYVPRIVSPLTGNQPAPAPAPVLPFPPVAAFSSTASPEMDGCDAKAAADRARAVAARGFWYAPSNNGHYNDDDESDEEADDYEERKILKKTISCFLSHEVSERRVSHANANPASQFAAALQSRASERDAVVVSATDAWAARIEIAGIPPSEALRRRNSNNNNQAMLVKQFSSLVLSSKSATDATPGPMTTATTTLYDMKDRSPHVRRGCRT